MSIIKVLTYNIHKGFGMGRIKFMLPKMREAVQATNADLVFLQEVQGEHQKHQKRIEAWPDEAQFEFLAKQLWPHYAYGKNAIYQGGHHGNAILSKYPFKSCENINVSMSSRASRSLLHGSIEWPETQSILHVICVHLGLFKNERNEQFVLINQRINHHIPKQHPFIMAGDFNDWRHEAVNYLEVDLGLHEVFKEFDGEYAKTFPAWRPTLAMDRIYYRDLQLHHGKRLTGKPWRALSDHLPLYAEFHYSH